MEHPIILGSDEGGSDGPALASAQAVTQTTFQPSAPRAAQA